jgi:hypothetical protein
MKEEMKWLFVCLTTICIGVLILAYWDSDHYQNMAQTIVYIIVTGMLAISTGGGNITLNKGTTPPAKTE